ncbi:MAG: Flp pilus assembly protein CpaB [Pseudomonadota bacterium]
MKVDLGTIRAFAANRPWLLPAGIALVGTLFLWKGVSDYEERIGRNMKTVAILVSTWELADGRTLRSEDLRSAPIPQKYLPTGGVRDVDLPQVVGRVLTRPMAEGEILLWPSIDVGLGPAGPARKIAKGYRAISLSVDAVSSVAHAVRPGDRIDLILTVTGGEGDDPQTVTLLQNLTVLSTGAGEEEGATYSVLSLMVLPREVPLIIHAERSGKISIVLRNPADHKTPQNLPIVTRSALFENALRNSLQEERNQAVEIIRGGKVSPDNSLP